MGMFEFHYYFFSSEESTKSFVWSHILTSSITRSLTLGQFHKERGHGTGGSDPLLQRIQEWPNWDTGAGASLATCILYSYETPDSWTQSPISPKQTCLFISKWTKTKKSLMFSLVFTSLNLWHWHLNLLFIFLPKTSPNISFSIFKIQAVFVCDPFLFKQNIFYLAPKLILLSLWILFLILDHLNLTFTVCHEIHHELKPIKYYLSIQAECFD